MTTIPVIDLSTRSVTYSPVSSSGPFVVPWPMFSATGDGIGVTLDGVAVAGWSYAGEQVDGFYGAPSTWVNGAVTLSSAVTGDLVIMSTMPIEREGQFAEGRGTPARDQNHALNKLTAHAQEARRDIDDAAGRIDGLESVAWLPGGGLTTVEAITDATDLGKELLRSETSADVFDALGEPYGLFITPEQYGCVADGATNDSANFQLAINAACTLGRILVVRGQYSVQNLTIPGSLTIIGAAKNKLIQRGDGTHSVFGAFNSGIADGIVVRFENVNFDGDNSGKIAGADKGIFTVKRIGSTKRNTYSFRGCVFENVHMGAILIYSDFASGITERLIVKDCIFLGISSSAFVTATGTRFIGAVDGGDYWIDGCYFEGNGTSDAGPAFWCGGYSTATMYETNVYFTNNKVKWCGKRTSPGIGAFDVYVHGKTMLVSGCEFISCWTTPIRAKSNCRDVIVTGNRVNTVIGIETGYNGIGIVDNTIFGGGKRCVISNNIISGVLSDGTGIAVVGNSSVPPVMNTAIVSGNVIDDCSKGIYTNFIDRAVICGNAITNVGAEAIKVFGTTNSMVSGNMLENINGVGITLNTAPGASIYGNSGKNIVGSFIRVQSCTGRIDISHNVGTTLSSYGVEFASMTVATIVTMATNQFLNTGSPGTLAGFYVPGPASVVLTNNTVQGYQYGIRVGTNSRGAWIDGLYAINVTTNVNDMGGGVAPTTSRSYTIAA